METEEIMSFQKDCVFCGCEMLEKVGGCGCNCHYYLDLLIALNHGDKERTKRDMMSAQNKGTVDAFNRNRMQNDEVKQTLDDIVEILRKTVTNKNAEVVIGTAQEGGDPSKLSIEDLIKYQIYMGIQKGRLKNGFVLDKRSKQELTRVLDIIEKDRRAAVCIAYIAGYERGFKFSKLQQSETDFGR